MQVAIIYGYALQNNFLFVSTQHISYIVIVLMDTDFFPVCEYEEQWCL